MLSGRIHSASKAIKSRKSEKMCFCFEMVSRKGYSNGNYLYEKRKYAQSIAKSKDKAMEMIWIYCKRNDMAMLPRSFHFSGFTYETSGITLIC